MNGAPSTAIAWLARRLARAGDTLRRRRSPLLDLALALRDPFAHPRPIEIGDTHRVLVLAPHMDDEAIGCGGAILLHRAAQADVRVVYLSDGSLGSARLFDGSLDAQAQASLRARLRTVRRAEALAWCAAADIATECVTFFDGPDGGLSDAQVTRGLAACLAAVIRDLAPQVIYLPSPLDTHADHRATNRIAADALSLAPDIRPVCVLRGYEVWSPLTANAVLDIGSVAERKLRMIGLHASQVADIDYARVIAGLNTYRSVLLPARGGHAEAFIELTPDALRRLLAAPPCPTHRG